MGKWSVRLLVGANIVCLIGLTIAVIELQNRNAEATARQAIADVITQYAYRWDAKDAHGFAALFTEDAKLML